MYYWLQNRLNLNLTLLRDISSDCKFFTSELAMAEVCCDFLSNCSIKSSICIRIFLFSLSRANLSVSKRSLFPYSSAFSLCNRSSLKKTKFWGLTLKCLSLFWMLNTLIFFFTGTLFFFSVSTSNKFYKENAVVKIECHTIPFHEGERYLPGN